MVILITFLLLFVILATPRRNRGTVSRVQPVVTNEQVHGWLHVWQRRFRLDEWKIDVKIIRVWELEQGTLGHIDWSSLTRPQRSRV